MNNEHIWLGIIKNINEETGMAISILNFYSYKPYSISNDLLNYFKNFLRYETNNMYELVYVNITTEHVNNIINSQDIINIHNYQKKYEINEENLIDCIKYYKINTVESIMVDWINFGISLIYEKDCLQNRENEIKIYYN